MSNRSDMKTTLQAIADRMGCKPDAEDICVAIEKMKETIAKIKASAGKGK